MSLVEKLQEYINTAKEDFPASLEMLAEDVQWVNRLPEHVRTHLRRVRSRPHGRTSRVRMIVGIGSAAVAGPPGKWW